MCTPAKMKKVKLAETNPNRHQVVHPSKQPCEGTPTEQKN